MGEPKPPTVTGLRWRLEAGGPFDRCELNSPAELELMRVDSWFAMKRTGTHAWAIEVGDLHIKVTMQKGGRVLVQTKCVRRQGDIDKLATEHIARDPWFGLHLLDAIQRLREDLSEGQEALNGLADEMRQELPEGVDHG